jgi:uncharacterized protein (TIGR03089 family)
MPTLLDALDEMVAADAARPLLTWYRDEARVELSGATVANWVAKTAGVLDNELLIGPGSTVQVAAGQHWLSLVVPLAVWRVGAALVDQGPSDLLVAERIGEGTDAAERLLLPDDPFGLSRVPAPAPWQLFSELVQAQPDRYAAPQPTSAHLAVASSPQLTHGQLADRGQADADALGLAAEGRLLVARTETSLDPLRCWCATIARAGSMILAERLTTDLANAERADVVS